jgi:hypothetical protein
MSVAGGSMPAGSGVAPLTAGETLDTAINLYRANAGALWAIVALVIVPLEVIDGVVHRLTLPARVFVDNGSLYTLSNSRATNTSGTIALLLVSVLGVFGQLLCHGASFKLLLDAYLGRSPRWIASLAFARDRIFSLLWLAIVATALIAVGLILFIAPGIWLIVGASVAVPALMLERLTGWRALRRSIDLVDRRWWATFGRLLVALVLYVVVSLLIGSLVVGISRALSVTEVTAWVAIDSALRAVALILMTPFIAAVITVVYIDLRVRKGGMDAARLDAAASAA